MKTWTTSLLLAAVSFGSLQSLAQQPAQLSERDYDLTEYFELTSALDVGQQVKLYFKGSNVWIDLNNNQQFDEGEQALVNTVNYNMYTLGSQTIRVYGNVEEFLCRESCLTAVDFTHFPRIKALGVSKNELTEIDITKNVELDYFECNSNKLTELDVTGLNKLTLISCQDNQISKLDISNKPGLYFLSVAKNKIKEAEMEDIVVNLPPKTKIDKGYLYVAVLSPSEGNVMTPDQVARAKAKEWDVEAWSGTAWVDFEGTETSLENILQAAPRLTAYYNEGVLHLSHLNVGQKIMLYTFDGRLVFEVDATDETLSIPCSLRIGYYLITNGVGHIAKLFVAE